MLHIQSTGVRLVSTGDEEIVKLHMYTCVYIYVNVYFGPNRYIPFVVVSPMLGQEVPPGPSPLPAACRLNFTQLFRRPKK